jgi:uncharacterized integral membrane protein
LALSKLRPWKKDGTMSTVRLVIVILVLGTVLLLAVQNTSPALPLVFLGMTSLALPLAVWLMLALSLGALTTLLFTALLGAGYGGNHRRQSAYKYRPQPFYEPSPAANAAAREQADSGSRSRPSTTADRRGDNRSQATPTEGAARRSYRNPPPEDGEGEWQAWTNLTAPSPYSDWETLSQAANQDAPPGQSSSSGSWFGRNRRQAEQQRVNDSMQELSEDWDNVDENAYRPTGASPVDDYLDDITQGWDDPAGSNSRGRNRPPREFEVEQSPTQVYRDGSVYSYRFRPGESTGQVDNIYAPADDANAPDASPHQGEPSSATSGYSPAASTVEHHPATDSESTYAYDNTGADELLDAPAVADDGVVDADYRVIIPPYSPAAEPATDDAPQDDDEWNAADDALTP